MAWSGMIGAQGLQDINGPIPDWSSGLVGESEQPILQSRPRHLPSFGRPYHTAHPIT